VKIQAAFAPPNNTAHIYTDNGLNEDIQQYLEKIFARNVAACKDVSKIFKGKNELETAHLIWLFLKKYCTYRRDPNTNQIIREVSYFVNRGKRTGDCKTFANFARTVYAAIYPDLETAYQYAAYRPDAIKPSHVYTVVKDRAGNKIIIDGCWTKFNSEKKYTLALTPKYRAMRITSLSGINDTTPAAQVLRRINERADGVKRDRIKRLARCRHDLKLARAEYDAGVKTKAQFVNDLHNIKQEMNGIGKLSKEERKKKVAEAKKKAKKGLKKFGWGVAFINLLPIRAAFTAILAMNVNAMAHNMKWIYEARNGKTKAEWKKIEKIWYGVGGLKKALMKAIELGAKHKPLFLSKKKKAKFDARKKGMADYIGSIYAYDGDGINAAPAIAAALAAAAGIIAAIIPAIMGGLGKLGKKKDQAQVQEEAQDMASNYKANPQQVVQQIEVGADNTAGEMESDEDPTINAMSQDGLTSLFDTLGKVAQVGIKAGGEAVARKAAKKPKLQKFLNTAGEAAEDYTTGVYLRKSGYSKAAKTFQSSGVGKYLPYAAGLIGLLGLGFILKKK